MPTAPSFANYKVLSANPFSKNGKMYITVQHPTTGNQRDVRWYTEQEFNKAYGNKDTAKAADKGFDGLKHARGFDNGPILVIRNYDSEADTKWLEVSNARYAVGIGWYIVSTETLPSDAPAHFKYLLLSWDEFRDGDDRHMKDPETLSRLLNAKMKKGEYFAIGSVN